MIRTITSGAVEEKTKFAVAANVRPRKCRKKGATPIRKQDQNDRDAVKRLARVINCNFRHGDLWVTLKYDQVRMDQLIARIIADGKTPDMDTIRAYAVRERDNFLRRVKDALKKQGLSLKYIKVTSDLDGETGEVVRIHHHLILSAAAREAVYRHWGVDDVRMDPLRDQKDYTPLAEYLIRQVRRLPDMKKYSVSRNMAKPIVKEEIVYTAGELKAPKGARLMHRSEYSLERPTQYIRYIRPERKRKRGGRKLLEEVDDENVEKNTEHRSAVQQAGGNLLYLYQLQGSK